ncbi:hypothetical protein COO60DRAFT_325199 [Scenedesmus sp. NREL 46B-D3]|nr:hypothetical protein COO60DRAFT_325199 [Scenedesmus sp. NREL 46B-D3]
MQYSDQLSLSYQQPRRPSKPCKQPLLSLHCFARCLFARCQGLHRSSGPGYPDTGASSDCSRQFEHTHQHGHGCLTALVRQGLSASCTTTLPGLAWSSSGFQPAEVLWTGQQLLVVLQQQHQQQQQQQQQQRYGGSYSSSKSGSCSCSFGCCQLVALCAGRRHTEQQQQQQQQQHLRWQQQQRVR